MRQTLRAIARPVGLTLLVVLVLVRLWATSDRDILALNQPYDDYWFIFTAHRSIWRGDYNQLAFAQLQPFAMWLKTVSAFGIPARLGLDLCWIAGAGYLGIAIRRLCNSAWPGVVAFAFLAYHPYSIALFDRALSENLTASLTAVALAALIDVWNFRVGGPCPSSTRQRVSILLGATAFAAAYHTRKEGLVLLIPLAFAAMQSAFHRTLWWGRGQRGLGVGIIAAPLLATLLVGLFLAAENAKHWGVFARYELAAPGYVRAIGALNAIDPEGPTPKWVTVTAATRARAYAVSTTFHELKPFLDGPMAQDVIAHTETFTGVKGEIGNGWFYWTLRDAASQAGWHRTAKNAEAHYNALADEIERAFDTGALHRRPVLIPFVDPDWHKWLPLLPGAFAGELRQTIAPVASDLGQPLESATEVQQEHYVEVAGRRRQFPQFAVSGWLIAPAGTRIALATNTEPAQFSVLEGVARPDVPGAIPFQLHANGGGEPPSLMIVTKDGTASRIPFDALQADKVQGVPGLPSLSLGIDTLSTSRRPPRADAWLNALCTSWSTLGWALLAIGTSSLAWIGRNENTAEVAARFVLMVTVVGIGARAALLAVLDSSSWSGTQARYLLPAVPMFAAFGALGAWRIGQRLRNLTKA